MADELAQAAVAAIDRFFGEHEGRAVHIKGGWAEGSFTATPEGTAFCRAAFFSGEPIPTLVRLSNGSGDPAAHDGERGGRGIAVKLFLPDGAVTDLLGITAPFFTSRTPELFIELLTVSRRDPETGQPDFEKLGPFLEAHPATTASIQATLGAAPPASWLAQTYNGIHAFRWIAAGGDERWVRTRWVPEGGEETLDDADAMAREPDYLATDLRQRLAAGPAAFTLLARIAQDGDPLDDASAAWPEDREAVAVGRLVLEHAIESPETPEDIHVFDPLRVCDGIEPSDDPILHFRRRAYDVSARRRWAGDAARAQPPERG